MAEERVERILEHVDADKREFLKRVLVGTGFAAPIVASFSMDGLAPNEAFAQGASANLTPG
jgi:hypothetical protein